MIRIAVIQFPGSNCERETALALKRCGMQPDNFFWNMPVHKLADYDGYIIVGGFSYEDRSRAGIIAAFDPIVKILAEQAELGKPVLGICNGAQILVEAGLVPGLTDNVVAVALSSNMQIVGDEVLATGFYNAWSNVRLADNSPLTAFTQKISTSNVMKMPVAHAEGRFIIPPVLLAEMKNQGMVVFQYCNDDGLIDYKFPINPNGSVDNIAAISNRAGNVLAMMPHPERSISGDVIFKSMREYIKQGHVQKVRPLAYMVREATKLPYKLPNNAFECVVGLKVTDNHAISIENVFNYHGLEVKLQRYQHWEIICDGPEIIEKMQATGFLFNSCKEFKVSKSDLPLNADYLLVQAVDELIGKKLLQSFKYLGIAGLHSIRRGVLWKIKANDQVNSEIISSSLFYNAFSHIGWMYKNDGRNS